MCFKTICIAVYLEQFKKLRGNVKDITSKLKKFYNELFNISFTVNFDGLNIVKTLEQAAKKYIIKFIIYNNRLYHLNTIGTSENIHNLLMISGPDEKNANNNNSNNISSNNTNVITHVMYIKDIQKYTKLHICPKCGYTSPTHNNSYHKDRFEEHENSCDGKILRSICLNEQYIPFIPHIQKNPVYAYLLAHNRSNEYRVIQEYIIYDFETVMKKDTHKISDKTSSYAQQLLLSVGYYINNSKTTKFMYRCEKTNEEFVNN
jgi:hypothetical protein